MTNTMLATHSYCSAPLTSSLLTTGGLAHGKICWLRGANRGGVGGSERSSIRDKISNSQLSRGPKEDETETQQLVAAFLPRVHSPGPLPFASRTAHVVHRKKLFLTPVGRVTSYSLQSARVRIRSRSVRVRDSSSTSTTSRCMCEWCTKHTISIVWARLGLLVLWGRMECLHWGLMYVEVLAGHLKFDLGLVSS